MKTEKKLNGNELTLCLQGCLDSRSSPELSQTLKEMPDSVESLVFDFKDLEYVTSAGIRVLLNAHNAMAKKGGMKLLNVNEEIMDVLDITGLKEILHIGKT